ncbi:MAG: hypothetical protein ABSG83_19910 [Roseiarcus sp.]
MIITPERRESQAPEPPVPEMVERIAKILWDQKLKSGGVRTTMVWPACLEAKYCRANAREILEALVEPTEAMIEAAWNANPDRPWFGLEDYAAGLYHTIREALR